MANCDRWLRFHQFCSHEGTLKTFLEDVCGIMTSQNLTLAIADLYARTIATGKITHSHRRVLSEAASSLELKDHDRTAIDRLLLAISGGQLNVVDE